MNSDRTLSHIFSVAVTLNRLALSIVTPLFLDALRTPPPNLWFNVTKQNATELQNATGLSGLSWKQIDPYFNIVFSMAFDVVLVGIVLGIMMVCCPGKITSRERNFPKRQLLKAGGAQGVSALMYQYSCSGTRTPPYLQSVLGYITVPVTFILRFFILHKRPTLLKATCVCFILIGEFVSLLPALFPWLESTKDRHEEGGTTGAARVLWPLCFTLSAVPHALWSILLEKSVKVNQSVSTTGTQPMKRPSLTSEDQDSTGEAPETNREETEADNGMEPRIGIVTPIEDVDADTVDIRRLNMVYVLFWNFLRTFLIALSLFWIDLIPGFGLMTDISLFGKQLSFNVRCIIGVEEMCQWRTTGLAWLRLSLKTSVFVTTAHLLRYSEGANFNSILISLKNPLLLFFWALFDEQPFHWHPHVLLSTWLAIVALAIMVPAMVVYNIGSPETTVVPPNPHPPPRDGPENQLLDDTSRARNSYGSINANT